MPTSKTKANQRAARGQASKTQLSGAARPPRETITRRTSRNAGARLDSSKSAAPPGKTSSGRSATLANRVSHASRGDQSPGRLRSKASVERKRASSKTANRLGRSSKPNAAPVAGTQLRTKAR